MLARQQEMMGAIGYYWIVEVFVNHLEAVA